MLLIILTPGVRLNERRSQTHEAWCKFNYREEETAESADFACAMKRKRARERDVIELEYIYIYIYI